MLLRIWITEIACADPRFDVSMQGQARFMQEVVPWLEQEEIIEKYAWFSYFTNDTWPKVALGVAV